MKKKPKGIKKIFQSIYYVIDKAIITPISRLIFNISEYLKNHNMKLDYILNRPHFMIYVSLILAVVVFLFIDSRVISLVESEAEVLTNIEVKVKYDAGSYVVEGIPKTVDIVLIGRKSDIYLAKQLGNNQVTLDLTDYEARESAYKVYLSYNKPIESINYKLDPSYVSVTIKDKINVTKDLKYELVNEQYLSEKLSVNSVSLSKTFVTVKSSKDIIDKIANVKALIDLNNESLKDVGTYVVDTITLVAYDSKGQIIDNVEITPGDITATITLDTHSKNVPIKVLTTGDLVPGKSIASISINGNNSHSVTVYGEQESLNNINHVPVTINVDGLGEKSKKDYTVTLNKQSGVRAISDKNVNITVTFGDEQQKELQVTSVSQKNLATGFRANIIGTSSVPVIVKGVQSEIDNVKPENITAYIDLEGYTEEKEYDVKVNIENDDPKLKYVVSSTIRVRLTKE